tara:strand:+ start:1346 stop:2047 length:702 start_codon:yes stop_codon:yes gene_type:complete
MSGISRIQSARETRGQGSSSNSVPGREVWFKDGDQAFISSLATGEEGDPLLDEIYMYTYNSGSRWVNLVDDDSVDTSDVPANTRPSHKFALWAYVHEIIHTERRNDEWEVVSGPGGRKMFKETVNDFRIISLTFGRSDYIWNQLVDVYNDWNGLNKGVMRIKRTGTGMFDTSYQIAGTARKEGIPDDMKDKVADLPPVKEYFLSRYSGNPNPTGGVSLEPALATTSSSSDDLF